MPGDPQVSRAQSPMLGPKTFHLQILFSHPSPRPAMGSDWFLLQPPLMKPLPLSRPTSQFPMGKAWPQWLCVHVQGSWTFRAGGKCLGSLRRRQESAGDKRDLTQFVTSNVRRVINPSEMGIHHRDQPELGFGKGPAFGFSQLNPSGPTLGTISTSHSELLPGAKPVGHQLQDVPCLKTRHKGERK